MDVKDRRIAEAGDAACAWHALDIALRLLCEARNALQEAGLDDHVTTVQELIEALEIVYGEAEAELTEVLLDGRDEARW